jgi:hypothetical protein
MEPRANDERFPRFPKFSALVKMIGFSSNERKDALVNPSRAKKLAAELPEQSVSQELENV